MNLAGVQVFFFEFWRRVIDLAQKQSVNIILMTQPYLWRGDLSEKEESLLFWGRIWSPTVLDTGEYYLPLTSAWILDQYNQTLLRVCQERKIDCIDLESKIPKSLKYFYDDIHFTELANQKIAEVISQELISRNLIESSSRS